MIPPKGSIPPDIKKGIYLGGGLNINRQVNNRDFGRNVVKAWKRPKKIIERKRKREAIADVFDEENRFCVVIELPHHTEKDFQHRIDNGSLILESVLLAFDYKESFLLPKDVLVNSMQALFNNYILEISFKKRRGKKQKTK